MVDMREHKGTIRAAVAKERQADENWSWNIKSVTKRCAKIGWGYLDYLGSKDSFFVEVVVDEPTETTLVVGTLPNGSTVHRLVGPESWNDCKTIGEGIASAIHGMACVAHNVY